MLKNPNPKTEVVETKADVATIAAGAAIETKAPVPAIAAKAPVVRKAPATETPKQEANKRQAAPDKQVLIVANANGKQCSSQ